MRENNSQKGVPDCYIFKSRLQEYAQKVGFISPVYYTEKEGPSHVPIFKSTVVVNGVKYESLPGFSNRKAAEQSAAEVALMELEKLGDSNQSLPTIHESGLCKNMLQEYAQKMNYAIPLYSCTRQDSETLPYLCTVEIGGLQYVGGPGKTKKEAEIKAARTALLAIYSVSRKRGPDSAAETHYTVLPAQKKIKESGPEEALTSVIPVKKDRRKKASVKRLFPRNRSNPDQKGEPESGGDVSREESSNGEAFFGGEH